MIDFMLYMKCQKNGISCANDWYNLKTVKIEILVFNKTKVSRTLTIVWILDIIRHSYECR